MADWSSALGSGSGISDQQSVGSSPGNDTCVLRQDTYHYCFVLQMGRKAVGPVCCAVHVKEPITLIIKTKGSLRSFLGYGWLQIEPCKLIIGVN